MAQEKKNVVRLSFVAKELSKVAPPDLNAYNKDIIQAALRPALTLLRRCEVEFAHGGEAEAEADLRRMLADTTYFPRKDPMARVLMLLSYIPANLIAMAEVDASIKALWRALLLGSSLSYQEVESLLGHTPVVKFSSSKRSLCEPALALASFIIRQRSYYSYSLNLERTSLYFADAHIRKTITPYILGEGAMDARVEAELPAGSCLTVVNVLDELPPALDNMAQMAMGGYFKEEDKMTTLRRYGILAKKAGLKTSDVFPETSSGKIDTAAMFAMAYCYYHFAAGTAEGSPDMASFGKFVAQRLGQYIQSNALQVLLPDMKGFSYLYKSSILCANIGTELKKLIAKAAEGWLSLDNFFLRYRSVTPNNHISPFLLPINFAFRDSWHLRVTDEGQTRDIADYFDDVARPYAVHWLALLCATGLAELAVDADAPRTDAMGGLRFIRLTALGRYALGYDKTYAGGPETPKKVLFDLDDDRHIVSLIERNKFIEPFMERIGTLLSPGRYKVNVRTILQTATTPEAIEGLYTNFCNMVCREPAPQWRALFDEAKARTASFTPLERLMVVVNLDPDVPGLIDFVTSSRDIAEHCFKAQGKMLIVPRSYYNDFLTLMRRAGYLSAVQRHFS